ncbi:lasso peptide isopeptide bond-forming cyclase [soil metagenome]
MLAAAPHRGTEHSILMLGHCALGVAINPTLPRARLARHGDLLCAVVGEIDNSGDVEGVSDPADPTAVAVGAFRSHGELFAAALRGTFVVAISDGKRVWCARDHFGFGPLFYRSGPEGFFAASEAKQVIAGAGLKPEPDLEVVEAILFGTYDDDTPSALKGVRRLPKTTVLRAEEGHTSTLRYWDPEAWLETGRYDGKGLQEAFDHFMNLAVGRVLTGSDVVSLSGGIDAPAIAAYAAPIYPSRFGRPLPALSMVFPNSPRVDERRYIEIVTRALGMDLNTYELSGSGAGDPAYWARLLDGPTPTLAIAEVKENLERAASLGYRTVLMGDIAEFLFDMNRYVVQHLLQRARFAPAVRHLASQMRVGGTAAGVVRQLAGTMAPRAIQGLYLRRSVREWRRFPEWVDATRVTIGEASSVVPARQRWRRLQLGAFYGPGLTSEAESICQALCAVRVRRPFADVDLWQFFLSLPAETKFPDSGRKTLVRRLLRGRVPDEILDRTDKTYFNDSILQRVDYPTLSAWLARPEVEIPGFDYAKLGAKLENRSLDIADYMWAKDLAMAHAFLSQW